MSALYKMNDRGKQLCEALGTALATDKSYSIIFFFRDNFTFLNEERKDQVGNQILIEMYCKDERIN